MAKSKAAKPPKSRAVSTSTLAQPHMSAQSAYLGAFSPDASLYAHVSQAVDRHRVRVYTSAASAAAAASSVLADYLMPEALECRAIAWVHLGAAASAPASHKKRRAPASGKQRADEDAGRAAPHLALGTSDGSVLLFSPQQAKVVRVLVASSPDSAAAGFSSLTYSDVDHTLYGTTERGWVQGWHLAQVAAEGTERVPPSVHFLPDSRTPTSLARAAPAGARLATAHHAIALHELPSAGEPACVARYTGHVTPVTHIAFVGEHGFVSAAADDRHLYYWDAAHRGERPGQPVAMLSLDAPARHVQVSHTQREAFPLLFVITQRGTARLYRAMPGEARSKSGVAPLEQLAEVHVEGAAASDELVHGAFLADGDVLRLARLIKGVKVVLDDARMRDAASGTLLPEVRLSAGSARGADADGDAPTQRYRDTSGAGARTEVPAGAAAAASLSESGMLPDTERPLPDAHDQLLQENGEMVDEPTLAQRLKALKVQRGERGAALGADGDVDGAEETEAGVAPVGGASLASSLTQALHSGDHTLLTSCLVHSEPTLVRTTVRRISGPLAVRLLEACVERLNRGGVRSKGALGSARARGIVEWIHQTMICHTAYLMSLPNLVTRLAQLHHSLAARLATHDRLLALRGRLDLVMSQIDMRLAYSAEDTPVQVHGQKLGRRAGPAERERREAAIAAQHTGQTWAEPEDDVEEIGLGADEQLDEEAEEEAEEGADGMDLEGDVEDVEMDSAPRRRVEAEGVDDDEDEEDEEEEEDEEDEEEDDEEEDDVADESEAESDSDAEDDEEDEGDEGDDQEMADLEAEEDEEDEEDA